MEITYEPIVQENIEEVKAFCASFDHVAPGLEHKSYIARSNGRMVAICEVVVEPVLYPQIHPEISPREFLQVTQDFTKLVLTQFQSAAMVVSSPYFTEKIMKHIGFNIFKTSAIALYRVIKVRV